MGIGAGNKPAFTFRQIVARDHPVASITADKRRNFLIVDMTAPMAIENLKEVVLEGITFRCKSR
jgi:hypothetical protein